MNKVILFIVIAIAVILGVDFYFLATGEKTISEVIRNLAFDNPLIPFFAGVLMGHWFGVGKSNLK